MQTFAFFIGNSKRFIPLLLPRYSRFNIYEHNLLCWSVAAYSARTSDPAADGKMTRKMRSNGKESNSSKNRTNKIVGVHFDIYSTVGSETKPGILRFLRRQKRWCDFNPENNILQTQLHRSIIFFSARVYIYGLTVNCPASQAKLVSHFPSFSI